MTDETRNTRRRSSADRRRSDAPLVPRVRVPPPSASALLLTTHIAGVAYHAAADGDLPIDAGSLVELHAEPDNPYDRRAVAIRLPTGERLGYIPRRKNTITARLLAQGVDLFGRLERVDRSGDHLDVDVSVLLRLKADG